MRRHPFGGVFSFAKIFKKLFKKGLTIYTRGCIVIIRTGHHQARKGNKTMMETVKIVNGYAIERMKGTRGFYEVTLHKTEKSRKYVVFKTIKAATEYIENMTK